MDGSQHEIPQPQKMTLEVLPHIPLLFAGSKSSSIAATFSYTFPPPRTWLLPLHVTVTQGISNSRTTNPPRREKCRSKKGLDTERQWWKDKMCSWASLVLFCPENKSCGLVFQCLSWKLPFLQNEAVLESGRPRHERPTYSEYSSRGSIYFNHLLKTQEATITARIRTTILECQFLHVFGAFFSWVTFCIWVIVSCRTPSLNNAQLDEKSRLRSGDSGGAVVFGPRCPILASIGGKLVRIKVGRSSFYWSRN